MPYRCFASLLFALSLVFPWTVLSANEPPQNQKPGFREFDSSRKVDAPIILCIDDKPISGGQPTDHAYAKAAANGFRSVLTLRSTKDAVDTLRERLMVEKHQLRYFNLPVIAPLPTHKQIDEFLGLLRDKDNHPMLANCAFIERVAPYMMMFRLVEQGWNEERAVEEASRSGLRRDALQALARTYLKSRANKSKPKARS
jgi:protein tyrosine phosphatase (PTP) superfamily phosphohydrolase (DUF442 family)